VICLWYVRNGLFVGLDCPDVQRKELGSRCCSASRNPVHQTEVQEVTRGEGTFQFGPAKSVNACSRCFTCIFDLGERKNQTNQWPDLTRPPLAAKRLTGRVQPCISRSLVEFLARAAPDSCTPSAVPVRPPQTVAGRAEPATSEPAYATTKHTGSVNPDLDGENP